MNSVRFIFLCFTTILIFNSPSYGQTDEAEYKIGTGIEDFTRLLNGQLPHNIGTYGYVHYTNPIDTTRNDIENNIKDGVHLPLKTRVISILHIPTHERFIYILLDMAFTSDNIRRGIMAKMKAFDPRFKNENLLITATHTHSAPAGFSDYVGYELAAPGYRPDFVDAVVTRSFEAIQTAYANEQPMQIIFNESIVPDSIPIAYSRNALQAYNNNPEIEEPISLEENYKATDRVWQNLSFNLNDKTHSFLSFFAAHPNRMGANVISSDTRGAASLIAEEELPENGVALFAQNAPGDIDNCFNMDKISKSNTYVFPKAYYPTDSTGEKKYIGRAKRSIEEGRFLKEQAFETIENPSEAFIVTGGIDCELIYVDMSEQSIPKGNYAKTLDATDYYKNDFFLWGNWGKFIKLFKPSISYARTSPPTIGLSAIARIGDNLETFVIAMERSLRYSRLGLSMFKDFDKAKYVWQMYRSQADKTVMLEGGNYSSAIGFRIGGKMFDIFSQFDPVLLELERDKQIGLHDEHTIYPTIVPIQIVIIGNVAILGLSGEPGNIAGQRIERAVFQHLKERGVKKVIANGYANENTGYIFTPEEYESQFEPQQCGFVLYGKWTEPAFRYNFELLAKAMLLDKAERENVLDRSIRPPVFSKNWYSKASYLKHIEIKKKE